MAPEFLGSAVKEVVDCEAERPCMGKSLGPGAIRTQVGGTKNSVGKLVPLSPLCGVLGLERRHGQVWLLLS